LLRRATLAATSRRCDGNAGIADPDKIGTLRRSEHGQAHAQSQAARSPLGRRTMPVPAVPGMSPGMTTPSPAAAPSANLGAQAHAAGQVRQALIMLETALPQLGLESPLHGAVRTSINALAKHLPAAAGQEQNLQASMLRDLALRQQQTSPLLAALAARGAGGGAPGAGATPPTTAGAPAPGA